MKKHISLFLAFILALMTLTACGGKVDADENTVYVSKKGKITGISVEKFDKDYYDAKELEDYVNQRVEDYLSGHEEKSVEVDTFSVEEGIAKLHIEYAGYEDYAAFNEVEMFVGTVPQAMAAGYDFDEEFLTVTDGQLGDTVDKDWVTADDKCKVVILSEKVNVKVDGTLAYVSKGYAGVKDKSTAAIQLPEDAVDGEELALVYVIYR